MSSVTCTPKKECQILQINAHQQRSSIEHFEGVLRRQDVAPEKFGIWIKAISVEPFSHVSLNGASNWYPGRVLLGTHYPEDGPSAAVHGYLRKDDTVEGHTKCFYYTTGFERELVQIPHENKSLWKAVSLFPWVRIAVDSTIAKQTWFQRLNFVVKLALAYNAKFDGRLILDDLEAASHRIVQRPVIAAIWRYIQSLSQGIDGDTESVRAPSPTPSNNLPTSSKRPSASSDATDETTAKRSRLDHLSRTGPTEAFDALSFYKRQKAIKEERAQDLQAQLRAKDQRVTELEAAAEANETEKQKLLDELLAFNTQVGDLKNHVTELATQVNNLHEQHERDERYRQALVLHIEHYEDAIRCHRRDKGLLVVLAKEDLIEQGLSEQDAEDKANAQYEEKYKVIKEPLLPFDEQEDVRAADDQP